MRTELHFLGIVIDLFYVDTVYTKDFSKYQGIPVFYNQGGLLYFEFSYGKSHGRLLERMLTVDYDLYKLSYPVDEGKVVFYDANDDILKTWKFKDAPIVHYKVKFDPNGVGMQVAMILSPAIQDYGCKINRSWHITPIEEETYQSPVYATEQIKKITKAIVDFRPSKDYDGEYGFDYMRDTDKKDNLTYKNILGTNRAKVGGKWIDKFKKYTTETKYNSLKDNHYKTITFPWHKDNKGKEIEYIQSWLTIYPKEKVTLSLQIETLENPKDLNLEYDINLFKLNTTTVPAQSIGKKRLKDHLTVECLKEFDKPQTIKVMLGSTQFVQLNILPNAKTKRKKAQVVFVKVTTELTKGKPKTGNTTNKTGKPEKEMLERYLKQAYIKLDLAEEVFDITLPDPTTKKLKYPDFNKDYHLIDTRDPKKPKILNKNNNTLGSDSLAEHMENIYNIEMPKYKDYYKIFFFGDRGGRMKRDKNIIGLAGHAKDFNSLCAIMYSGKRKATVTHELLHAMGLKHSFSDSADYGYKKKATQNIMDYSKTRKNTWLWQWKKLWTNKDLKNE
jgi:hypothetical protein